MLVMLQGIDGKHITSGTHRAQDNARFIAELVIVVGINYYSSSLSIK